MIPSAASQYSQAEKLAPRWFHYDRFFEYHRPEIYQQRTESFTSDQVICSREIFKKFAVKIYFF
jgi:hypothetical protein